MKEKIVIHVCCGICSIIVFDFLKNDFEPIGFWYNPNIHPYSEYIRRLQTCGYVFNRINKSIEWNLEYDIIEWFNSVLPFAKDKKIRCGKCYQLRLEKTAQFAKNAGIKIFSTTMLYSIHQDCELIKNKGFEIAEKYELTFLPLDLRQYYQKGQQIAREWKLYRQKYCGCLFSELEREKIL
ncbi:MAG: epoxyqueuosine reductase QueH [Candidatus Omnitrophica bacterium]|jgi:predicted adenine nucleotide alpha hydrolase (AANH) superfamily ATPase|nr:epoxyqueuosine reductase QueH [Candidatus Omnitrophota bacterium]